MGEQCLKQIGHTFAVFARNRNRIAKAKRIALKYPVIALLTLCLVDRKHHRCSTSTQPAGDFGVKRRNPGTAIDQEQGNLRARNRGLGLHPHPPGEG